LRDGDIDQWLANGASVEWHDVDVAIVGGGVAGLAAAYRLERAGCREFVLLELEETAGGTARSGSRDGFSFPWGAHYLPLPRPDNEPLVQLLEEMGVVRGRTPQGQLIVDETALCRDPQERLHIDGEWREDLDPWDGADAVELRQFAAFRQEVARWTRWRDPQGRRAFALPSSRSSDDAEVLKLDQRTMAQWLAEHGWNSPRLRWFVDYACRDDYGMSIDEVSAWAGLFYFCARQPEGVAAQASNASVEMAADNAGSATNATGGEIAGSEIAGSKARSVADTTAQVVANGVVSDGVDSQPLLTWPEGNGRLVRHLRSVAGSRVLTGCPVLRIRPSVLHASTDSASGESRAEVIAASVGNAASTGNAASPGNAAGQANAADSTFNRSALKGWRARRVICAVPQFVARRLIVDMPPQRAEAAESFQYGAWMVANVHVRDRPRDRGFPLAWDNVDYRSDSLGYVVATHQRGIDHGPTVWTWYHAFVNMNPREARRRLFGMSWVEAATRVLADLERVHPEIRSLATRVDVMRWGHAMIRPYPGFRSSDARRLAACPLGLVHFAHSELSGLALFEEAFDQACRAADEVLDQLGRQR
jgi:phytoene dehydrogenase-like protein